MPNLVLAVAFAILVALGGLVGQRANHQQEAERFYRWILSVSTQVRIFGDDLIPETAEKEQYVDEALYARLVEESESLLPDLETKPSDYDESGELLPKVVRYVAPPRAEDVEEVKESGAILTEDQIARQQQLWELALSPEMASLRKAYSDAASDKQLYSMGTSFGRSDLYSEGGGTVSLANLFFGFRKMAANLLWLEVDSFWHKGMIHRMVPLMNTTVMLDPTFIDAYLLGAWHLSYNQSARMDATPWELRHYRPEFQAWAGPKEDLFFSGISFLKDGIRKNPRNYKLYFDAGFAIYDEKLQDYLNAERFNSEAIRLDHDRWVRRTLYREMGLNGKFEEAKAGWEDYLKRYPDNAAAPGFIRRMDGMMLERDAQYALEKEKVAQRLVAAAEAAGDAAAAAAWQQKVTEQKAEYDRILNEVYDFWMAWFYSVQETIQQEETFSLARATRVKAMRLAREGRYLEAIAEIDSVRMKNDEFFWEGTEMMMNLKQEAGIPLELTELKKIRTDEIKRQYTELLPRVVEKQIYEYKLDRWVPEAYRGQPMKDVAENDPQWLEVLYDNPSAARIVDELPGDIVLRIGEDWYFVQSETPPDVPPAILEEMGFLADASVALESAG